MSGILLSAFLALLVQFPSLITMLLDTHHSLSPHQEGENWGPAMVHNWSKFRSSGNKNKTKPGVKSGPMLPLMSEVGGVKAGWVFPVCVVGDTYRSPCGFSPCHYVLCKAEENPLGFALCKMFYIRVINRSLPLAGRANPFIFTCSGPLQRSGIGAHPFKFYTSWCRPVFKGSF